MKQFSNFSGLAAAMLRSNIDTDQIIPKQFLRSIKRTGFGVFLFNDWRYETPADLTSDLSKLVDNTEFTLNKPRYKGAQILIAGTNFGCGSSREHAVWALLEYGFRAIIAPSFGDIFTTNSAKNGLLLIKLEAATVNQLAAACAANKGYSLAIDLEQQLVKAPAAEFNFAVEASTKQRLSQGLDDIAITMQQVNYIKAYEDQRKQAEPWLFDNPSS